MTERDQLYRKIGWRVLPLLMVGYIFAYLDRVNVGFAKLQMQQDVGLSDAAYGLGAGIFFIGYVLFEIPSNLLLPKIGARRTFSRILILWGLTSAAMMFVRDAHTFYALRFLLGVFEAGFGPGMLFYLTYWYPRSRMGRVLGFAMCAGPVGGMLGGPLSGWIMSAFNGAHGLAGWQWMFLLEGLPCVLLGVLAFKLLADRPDEAHWLTPQEKAILAEEVTAHRAREGHGPDRFRAVLRDRTVYKLAGAYFCLISGIYTVSFWLPTLLSRAGVQDTAVVGLYSAIPYACAVAAIVLLSRYSDRLAERHRLSAIGAVVCALALAVMASAPGDLAIALASLTIATAAVWAAYSVFWAIPSDYLRGESAAGGIALINTIGLFGGFLSPVIIGWVTSAGGTLETGLLMMAALLVAGAALLLLSRRASYKNHIRAKVRS